MDHAFGVSIPLTIDEVCRPDRTALLVYDMQVGIVSQIPTGGRSPGRFAGSFRRLVRAARLFYSAHVVADRGCGGCAAANGHGLAARRSRRQDQTGVPA